MKRSIQCAFLALALLSLLGCCQTTAPEFTAEDEATITGMFDTGLANFMAGDWAAWAADFTADGILQPSNGPALTGHAALIAWGEALPSIEAMSWPNVKVWGEGNMAYATSDYVMNVEGMPEDRGKHLVVLRRGVDGDWKIAAVCSNSDLPLPMPDMPAEE